MKGESSRVDVEYCIHWSRLGASRSKRSRNVIWNKNRVCRNQARIDVGLGGIGVGRKSFVSRGLGLEKIPKKFFLFKGIPSEKNPKDCPGQCGFSMILFWGQKGVLRTGYGCNCKKIAGEGGVCWRPEDLNIYEFIVQDCEDKNRTV